MSNSKAYQAWINAGYDLFAQEGYDGIQIERLARIIDMNKSGFYHYFGDRDTYFKHLMQHHLNNADRLVDAVQSMHSFVPDYIQFLMHFSTPILVHKQLVRESHHPLFTTTFIEGNKKVDPTILPLWANFIGMREDPVLASRFFEFFRDMFFVRVNKQNLNYEFIHALCMEAKDIYHGFKNSYGGARLPAKSA
jgi:AcrR family transcriptional regulator